VGARFRILKSLLVAPVVLLAPSLAAADIAQCHVVDVKLQPATSDLQIVAWVEDTTGKYIDTIFITQETGRFGLGNRPGRFDFNSGPPKKDNWPYGRRTTVFPVWSHHHRLQFPQVMFQNGDENNLSHPLSQSSAEHHFCRPQLSTEPSWDAGTCATANVGTDKGTFSPTEKALYPPRIDVVRAGEDSPSVDMYKMLDPFDAVSQATPTGGAIAQLHWRVPPTLQRGSYVLWVEVARAFDFNATYNSTTYPAPTGISFGDYGKPYRGQPSIIYKQTFTIDPTPSSAEAVDFFGHGDPAGIAADPIVDQTITTDTPGSGASRLQLVSEGTMYRLHIDSHPEVDNIAPARPQALEAIATTGSGATLQFVAPGDDGQIGKVTGYDIKIRANTELTADNFSDAMPITTTVIPSDAGTTQMFEVTGLLPETDYYIGVRAYDDCRNVGELLVAKFTTGVRQGGEVSSCFIATAAYGSIMANDVEMLRRFRDVMLRSSVLGELAIETYYTFGPAVAGVVSESELLRQSARDVLGPIVSWARTLSF
jgi:hypothetical protein